MQQIKTALLSFGMSGKLFHAPFLDLHPGYDLYAVWERTKNLAEALYPRIKTCRKLEELLSDSAVELVVINTPNNTHFEFASMALEAGKHILVEKPFTTNAREAEALIRISENTGRNITVYHNRRWDSDFLTAKKIVASGVLGTIVDAEIHYDRYSPALSPKTHKETPGPATGVLHDLGAHLIDASLQLFGYPQAVFADLRTIRNSSRVNDYMNLLLYYPQLRVYLKSSYLVKETLPAFIFHGTSGSFFKSRADVQEGQLLQGMFPGSNGWGKEPEKEKGWYNIIDKDETCRAFVETETGNYMTLFDRLYETIRMKGSNPVPASEALHVMKIIDASLESHRQKKLIELK